MTNDELISAAYDPEITAVLCRTLAESLQRHLRKVQSAEVPVSSWIEPVDNIHHADQILQQASATQDIAELGRRFEQLVELSLSRGQNLNHPHCIGHQVPAPLPLAGLFEAITTITNQVQGVYEMGPWAVSVERALIERIGTRIGFASGFGGLVTSGGSLANLTALLAARNKTLRDCWSRGMPTSGQRPVMVVSADAHYCVDRAAAVLGLGTDQVIRVGLDSRRRMDVARLAATLRDLRRGSVPMVAVVAVAGATPTGAFDPLADVHAVCQEFGVWFHVDASHGGAVCFSGRHRHLVHGLELADSVVMDAHKMMFLPALCAFVFYRDGRDRFSAFQQTAPYLFDPSSPDMAEYDNGVVTFECTKRAAAIGLWGVWSLFGPDLFAALVDQVFAVAKEFYELLRADPDFEVFGSPQCNIVVFRYLPSELQAGNSQRIDTMQLQLRQKLNRSGQVYLTQTKIAGRIYLRSTIMNPLTRTPQLQQIITSLRSVGQTFKQPSGVS